MAASLYSNFLSLKPTIKTLTKQPPATHATVINIPIRCGPRSNRGPLVKGRILSTEAILAVQQLKRAYKKSQSPSPSSPNSTDFPNLTRLIKSDLLSMLRELLRQDLCPLALHVLSTLRSEYPSQIDLNLYGELISALSRNHLLDDIDRVIEDLEKDEGGIEWETDRGVLRVIRGTVEAGRKESTVKIYQMMKKSGCGDTWPADEYIVSVLSKGLRRMGEEELANEVYKDFGGVFKGAFEKSNV
ncbi:protein THYLAKOID ASSEMBLY 8, chloroplastic [Euphorbia lathyris]|uniref:protein THYLAKOID ASSEMBLY 8, chloroplastic n=1 Tax=Euphorbia lathyris TaxID=212925 RepID=UPI003313DC99